MKFLGLIYNPFTDKLYSHTRKGNMLEFDKHELIKAIENEENFVCGKTSCGREMEGQQRCEYSMNSRSEYICQRKLVSPPTNEESKIT